MDLVQVIPENLDADHRADAGGQHVHAVDDRLRPDVAPAGHLGNRVHFLEQAVLALAPQKQAVSKGSFEPGLQSVQLVLGRRAGPEVERFGLFPQLLDGLPGVKGDCTVKQLPIPLLDALRPLLLAFVLDGREHRREKRFSLDAQYFADVVRDAFHSRRGEQQQVRTRLHKAARAATARRSACAKEVTVGRSGDSARRGPSLAQDRTRCVNLALGHGRASACRRDAASEQSRRAPSLRQRRRELMLIAGELLKRHVAQGFVESCQREHRGVVDQLGFLIGAGLLIQP